MSQEIKVLPQLITLYTKPADEGFYKSVKSLVFESIQLSDLSQESINSKKSLILSSLKIHQTLSILLANGDLKSAKDVKSIAKFLQQNYQSSTIVFSGQKHEDTYVVYEELMRTIAEIKPLGEDQIFSVTFNKERQGDKILFIDENIANVAVTSKGKADMFFQGYILTQILASQGINSTSPSIVAASTLAKNSLKINKLTEKFTFTQQNYNEHVKIFVHGTHKQIQDAGDQLWMYVYLALLTQNKESLEWIERLLIQLLGHDETNIRDRAIVFMNCLLDEVDWQQKQAFNPIVSNIGEHFMVKTLVVYNPSDKLGYYLEYSRPSLQNPSLNTESTQAVFRIALEDSDFKATSQEQIREIQVTVCRFEQCGFYDWRIISVSQQGKIETVDTVEVSSLEKSEPKYVGDLLIGAQDELDYDLVPCQGRFIVHSEGIRDTIMHEVFIDHQNATFENNKVKKRGTFEAVTKSLPQYQNKGYNTLYLMGVLERDNERRYNEMTKQYEYQNQDSNPLAITSRAHACQMLGGDEKFSQLTQKAKDLNIKIVVDCLARVSSARHHKKYRDVLLTYLKDGVRKVCYGTDGRAIRFDDTATLNYRKKESWDLLLDDVVKFVDKYGVGGIHLDNAQAWPQIYELDKDELYRKEIDGEAAYDDIDILNGEIVLRNENHGFWHSNQVETYPNPFYVKLCKTLWRRFTNFTVIGEAWGGHHMENREGIMARSGIIPRMFKLPQSICSVLGKKLHKDGRLTQTEQKSVDALRQWYEKSRQFLPRGSVMIQSSSSHTWPYPAFLYERGTWAAIDILFFMPDIPMTFMREIDGDAFRIPTISIIQDVDSKTIKQGGLKRTNSKILLALQEGGDSDEEPTQSSTAQHQEQQPGGRKKMKRTMSGSNLDQMVYDGDIQHKEQELQQKVGPQHGFDLSKISKHYEHRIQLRKEKISLRLGSLIPLQANNSRILAFARYTEFETAIIAINLQSEPLEFELDLNNLREHFTESSQVLIIQDWNGTQDLSSSDYYHVDEYIGTKKQYRLNPFQTSIFGLIKCQSDDEYVKNRALESSMKRTQDKILQNQSFENTQAESMMNEILKSPSPDIQKFGNVLGFLQEHFIEKSNIDTYDLFKNNKQFRADPKMSSRLMALCKKLAKHGNQNLAPIKAAFKLASQNELGPILFVTPEIGRWSTVGGLGVMVDELSIGLAELGQDVHMISPYYHKNRKGETGYLAKDPAGIHHTTNVTIKLQGGPCTFGVHQAIVSGVKQYFLHNETLFPSPYADGDAAFVTRQMTAIGKASLELCCNTGLIPSIVITNDWFTGFVAAYNKAGHFGDTFGGTQFLHIAHNLQQSYEGRVYPGPRDGNLSHIHELPDHWVADPLWKKIIINPSRCALFGSNQWATVSKSYRNELLNESPLAPLLKMHPHPFAFPNGVIVKARRAQLESKVGTDHLEAKKLLQTKYFGFKDLNDEIPLYSFVGRVTEQKGVYLILEAAEELIPKYQNKIQFLVGGPANPKDPYAAKCASWMISLKERYPHSFWAGPDEFFTDGPSVNLGSDYALMPSLFEPGGIVQHEFFVAGTPVIAHATGGLKDSVFEFSWDTKEGNGCIFLTHKKEDLMFAIERSIGTFNNKDLYKKVRENAYVSVMDVAVVKRAWMQEFCRMKDKIFVDEDIMNETLELLGEFDQVKYENDRKVLLAEQSKREEEQKQKQQKEARARADSLGGESRLPFQFRLSNRGNRYQSVQLSGSFDNWQVRHQLYFDTRISQWVTTLHLPKGKYFYKYIVNGGDWRVNDQERKLKDPQGNLNNYLEI